MASVPAGSFLTPYTHPTIINPLFFPFFPSLMSDGLWKIGPSRTRRRPDKCASHVHEESRRAYRVPMKLTVDDSAIGIRSKTTTSEFAR
jgi:hypothetical protein